MTDKTTKATTKLHQKMEKLQINKTKKNPSIPIICTLKIQTRNEEPPSWSAVDPACKTHGTDSARKVEWNVLGLII